MGMPLFLVRMCSSSSLMYLGFSGGGTPSAGPNSLCVPSIHQWPSRLCGSGLGGAEPAGAGPEITPLPVRDKVGSSPLYRLRGLLAPNCARAAEATATVQI